MQEVKLLTVKEDIVSCVSLDNIHVRYALAHSPFSYTSDHKALLTEEKIKHMVFPIQRLVDITNEELEGYEEVDYDYAYGHKRYIKTEYFAVDHTQSTFLNAWVNSQNDKVTKAYAELRVLQDKIKNSNWKQRIKYLFTGKFK